MFYSQAPPSLLHLSAAAGAAVSMVHASYQAVVLAGGEDQILYPLTTTTVKALLPVANKPLISYPLRTLAEAGLRSAIVVSVAWC